VQRRVVNIFATPPKLSDKCNVKYCPRCYQLGILTEGEIDRGTSMYCPKHYRIQSSRNRALIRKLHAPSLQELEAMIPKDMTCRLCQCEMGYSIRDVPHSKIMSLQHWKDGKVEWICVGCNSRHSTTQEPDDKWIELLKTLKPDEKLCPICKKVKDIAFFYKSPNGSKGRTAYCQVCHDEYIRNKRQPKQSNICP